MFCSSIKRIGEKYPDVQFSFEAELEMNKLNDIISLCDNFKVTYDTGNATSCRFDHKDFIHFFGHKISNVHLKDSTFDANTVEPTTGDTDFSTIFKALHDVGYDGPFVIQTARNKSGLETETILKHKQLFEDLYV